MALSVGRSCPTKDEFLMEVGKSQSLMEVLVSRFGIRYQTIITVCVCVCVLQLKMRTYSVSLNARN